MAQTMFSKCSYNKVKKTIEAHIDRMQLEDNESGSVKFVDVISDRTGVVIRFNHVQPGDLLFDEDGWDGMLSILRPSEECGINYLAVYYE